MRIFAAEEASNDGGLSKSHDFSVASVAMLLEPLEIRPKLSHRLTTHVFYIFCMDSTFCWDILIMRIVAGVL